MRISVHSPLLLAPVGVGSTGETELRRCVHAALWLSVVLDRWGVRRSGHLHLIREADRTGWREVDLTRHPLQLAQDAVETDRAEIEDDLRRTLANRLLHFYRIPEIGVVSEIGEGREDFRRRVMGLLRPELQRRIAASAVAPAPGLPWRRRAAARRKADERERLATEFAGLAGSIEAVELPDLTEHVHRAEIGLLLVAPGVRLEAPRHRTLMISEA